VSILRAGKLNRFERRVSGAQAKPAVWQSHLIDAWANHLLAPTSGAELRNGFSILLVA
jgi:hypothetical protein